jgi:fatty acid desaturase
MREPLEVAAGFGLLGVAVYLGLAYLPGWAWVIVIVLLGIGAVLATIWHQVRRAMRDMIGLM